MIIHKSAILLKEKFKESTKSYDSSLMHIEIIAIASVTLYGVFLTTNIRSGYAKRLEIFKYRFSLVFSALVISDN